MYSQSAHVEPASADRDGPNESEVLVRVNGVSKKFCRDLKKSLWYGIRDVASELLPFRKSKAEVQDSDNKLRSSEFWANKNISFELRRGECIGLIGRNGAGKTTLLKILNGLIKPDQGSITMKGRVGALISLGAGFNPILTGRENIYVNGSILGIRKKEIDRKIDEIVEFAEIHDFIDAPVQSYSSGMQVRLGFAISTALSPDILIVDEVLAVGDTNFKVKCYNRIRELLANTAVILVSHNMTDIARACTSAVVMKKGMIHYHGEVTEGIQVYNRINAEQDKNYSTQQLVINTDKDVTQVDSVQIRSETNGLNTRIHFSCDIDLANDLGEVRSRFVFFDQSYSPVAEWDSKYHASHLVMAAGRHKLDYTIDNIRLRSGVYRVAYILADANNHGYHVNIDQGMNVEIMNEAAAGSAYKI